MIGPILNDVLAWFRSQSYAEATICNYLKAVPPLIQWLQRRRGRKLKGLTRCDLVAAYDHFHDRQVAVAAAARSFGRYLTEHRLIPAERSKPPSHSEKGIQHFGSYLPQNPQIGTGHRHGASSRVRPFLQFLKLDGRPSAIRRLTSDDIGPFFGNPRRRTTASAYSTSSGRCVPFSDGNMPKGFCGNR